MRKILTVVLVAAIAVVAVAAVVDAFVGGTDEPRLASATGPAPTDGGSLPVCDRGQLALGLEVLGETNAVSLRHVKGASCRAAGLNLRVFVTSDGHRAGVPLGNAADLDGDYPPGVERSVPFSFCKAGSNFIADATAAPYRASGPVQPGGVNCEGAIREMSVDLGREPGTVELRVAPLDPVTHKTSFVIDFPRRADLRVLLKAGDRPILEVPDTRRPARCRPIGSRGSCEIDYEPLGKRARKRWM